MDEVVVGIAETRADLLTENASRKGKEKNFTQGKDLQAKPNVRHDRNRFETVESLDRSRRQSESHLASQKARQRNRGIFRRSLGLRATFQYVKATGIPFRTFPGLIVSSTRMCDKLPQAVGNINRLTLEGVRPIKARLDLNPVYIEKVDKVMREFRGAQLRASVESEDSHEAQLERTYG
jgi:hypothetical protein